MLDARSSEASRLEVQHTLEAQPPPSPAFNPHVAPAVRHVDAVDRLVDVAESLKDPDNGARLLQQRGTGPRVAPNAARAAAVARLSPAHTTGLIYFCIQLAASLDSGALPGPRAGFLLLAALELLLADVQWLAVLVRLHDGSGSPHLRALHATLKAYESQADYANKMRGRAEQMQGAVAAAIWRADAADKQAADALDAAEVGARTAESLTARNAALEADAAEAAVLRERLADMELQSASAAAEASAHAAALAARNGAVEAEAAALRRQIDELVRAQEAERDKA
ncbi:hypothetical protein FOA52_008000 [Chlamydomonas sp. UWO 241]|nr:hypothetical protein FOA52_008000 [Chlamydomonas sp. UWO 241]